MVHNVALVLGGGGAAGNAWQIGVIAGLAEAGLDLTQAADLVIGTSAGSTAAAHVRSGKTPAELLEAVLSAPGRPGGGRPGGGQQDGRPPGGGQPGGPGGTRGPIGLGGRPGQQAGGPTGPAGQNHQRPQALPTETVFERMRAISAAATSAADLQRAMGAFGLESDVLLDPAAAEQRRALVASRLPNHEWPEKPMILVAVNAHTGEVAPLDRDSGVDLVDAVIASTALPGLVPTQNINGTHYINGGVRSGENADLATGYANIIVISPFGGRSRTADSLPEGQFEGLRREAEWGTTLDSQVEALRTQGSRVAVITPDADSVAAMGTNQMDPATRIPSAHAGFAQGKLEASRITFT